MLTQTQFLHLNGSCKVFDVLYYCKLYCLLTFISYIFSFSLGGFTVLLTAAEKQSKVRGAVLLNSAGQFGDPNKKSDEPEGESAIGKFVLKPLKEAFQRVVLGFVFWQSKQPARIEKVLKSVSFLTDVL